ncbi:MAG TPA: FtsX-like permease family protein, partial [Acidimicrobiales bacterium]
MEVVVRRATWLVRRYFAVTLLLALGAGLAGGLAMTAWLSARRAASTVDRFTAAADPPELTVTFCPPDVTSLAEEDLLRCLSYRPTTELARLRSLPEVAAAGRMAYQPVEVRLPPSGPGTFESGMLLATGDDEVPSADGAPIVLAGRLADPDAPDEATINAVAAQLGLALGDRLTVRWPAIGEAGLESGFSGPERTLEIVGIVRTGGDLSATVKGRESSAVLAAGPGVWRSIEDQASMGYAQIAVQARDGDGAAARAAILAAFPGQMTGVDYLVGPDDTEPLREAFGYDASAARAFAVFVALAGVIFVGQAVARQMRREWADLPALRAVGLSRRQAGAAAAVRGLAIAVPAGAVAAAATLVLSPTTPYGSARIARLDRGIHADPIVICLGASLVVAIVVAVAWLPVWRLAGP